MTASTPFHALHPQMGQSQGWTPLKPLSTALCSLSHSLTCLWGLLGWGADFWGVRTTGWEELTHWKEPDAGKDWGQEEKGIECEMVGWHHRLNGHEFGQTPGDGEGQGSLASCSACGCRKSDPTEWLNSNSKGPLAPNLGASNHWGSENRDSWS